jgi:spore coat-associated protein N
MQRITALWQSNPLKLVSALFVLSLAAMMAVASGASFTSTSANAGNIVTAGNLTHSNSRAPGAILNVTALKPGGSQSGTVDITNTGDVSGVFTVSESNILDSDTAHKMSQKLNLVVTDLGDPGATTPPAPVVKYSGKLGSMTATDLGAYATGDTHRYKFTVTFPDGGIPPTPTSGDNLYKGGSVTADFNWESVSN